MRQGKVAHLPRGLVSPKLNEQPLTPPGYYCSIHRRWFRQTLPRHLLEIISVYRSVIYQGTLMKSCTTAERSSDVDTGLKCWQNVIQYTRFWYQSPQAASVSKMLWPARMAIVGSRRLSRKTNCQIFENIFDWPEKRALVPVPGILSCGQSEFGSGCAF